MVIDLEMCRIGNEYRRKEFPHRHEIIQIGAVMLDEEGQLIDEISIFVHPVYGRVDRFIQDLTGIHEKMLTNAPLIRDALSQLLAWAGDDCKKVYAWSSSDRAQLMHEIQCKNIDLPGLKEFMDIDHWVDYQRVFSTRFQFSWSLNLQQALDMTDTDTEGHVHNGLDDARNTARLISKLEMNPDFILPIHNYTSSEDESTSSGFSMGELFSADLLAALKK